MLRELLRLSAGGALLGRHPGAFMAAMTCCLVAACTSGLPFATRDTVWVETPANTATSTSDTVVGRLGRPRDRIFQSGVRDRRTESSLNFQSHTLLQGLLKTVHMCSTYFAAICFPDIRVNVVVS